MLIISSSYCRAWTNRKIIGTSTSSAIDWRLWSFRETPMVRQSPALPAAKQTISHLLVPYCSYCPDECFQSCCFSVVALFLLLLVYSTPVLIMTCLPKGMTSIFSHLANLLNCSLSLLPLIAYILHKC